MIQVYVKSLSEVTVQVYVIKFVSEVTWYKFMW